MFGKHSLNQYLLLAFLILGFVFLQVWGDIIPVERRTIWNPGLNAVGGIPNRATIYKTLMPSGGDDTKAIQDALNNCPANQVVMLGKGTFNISGNGLSFRKSNITLRGSGTGTPGSGNGGTRLIKADRATNPGSAILYMGPGGDFKNGSGINLTTDAIKGSNSVTLASNPGLQVGEFVLIDHITTNDPQAYWGPNHDGPGGGSRRWFCRQDRSLTQIMEITAVNGNTVTFATPFHITFKTAYQAQLSRLIDYAGGPVLPFIKWSGIENIYFYGGMGGDYHGNVSISNAAYCWVKNIESHWSVGTSVGLYSTYRCEVRDSYIHETPDPNPGGAGYLSGINYGASDNLIENNIMWFGNKVVVMRASGGGNVFAYNYTDDAFGSAFPQSPEAGINAGHYTTPHMELLEGNYSHNYKGDSFWGNSIYITAFRNHLSALRAAHPPLNTYTFNDGQGHTFPYMDIQGRVAADIQGRSDYHNMVGNVLGLQGQKLLSYNKEGYSYTQTSWIYEALSNFPASGENAMWSVGSNQTRNGWTWSPNQYQTLLREGNWDWVTQSQKWHGIGGAAGSSTPQVIPNSLYLTQKPAFFNGYTWPWVQPEGTTKVYRLPAKDRFEGVPPPSIKPNYTNGIIMPLSLAVVPNFLDRTIMVQYEVKNPGKIEASIYNVSGEKIKNLICEEQNAGNYSIVWDGKIRNNQNVSQGMYYILVEQNGNQACKVFPFLK